jgi:VIT1/CCC1 family predicted Fe2+/Mn2+ transporter
VTANPERWVRMMLRDEYGLPAAVRSPWRAAGSTFSAFLICGLIPLLPFLAGVRRPFEIAAAVTAVVFLGIGALKSRWSVEPWWLSALSTLAIGGGAAVVAYFAGAWLRGFAG